MAVEITETPRHTLTVSEQNWQLKLSTVGVADLPDNATFNNLTVSNLLTANHIHGEIAGSLYIHVEAQENLTKGDPVYISGFNSGTNQPKVRRARADNALKMPAIGVISDSALAGAAGLNCIISGIVDDVNTQGFGINTPIYVGLTGGFTSTKPSANVQQVGICDRDQQNNGSFVVTTQSVSSNQNLNTTDDVVFNQVELNGGGISGERMLISCDDAGDATIDTQAGGSGTGTLQLITQQFLISGPIRLQPSTTPSGPYAGMIYFDSSTNKLRCFDGTTWNNLF